MSDEQVPCLFCQVKNDSKLVNCSNCGMALAEHHPAGKARRIFFSKAFWGIVIFCVFMMYYLPR